MTKIEEVARAICKSDNMDVDKWANYVHIARAAISAMQLISPELADAGRKPCGTPDVTLSRLQMMAKFEAVCVAVLEEGE